MNTHFINSPYSGIVLSHLIRKLYRLIGTTKDQKTLDELEWIQVVRTELNENANIKQPKGAIQKFKENPLVPIGATATVAALSYGLYNTFIGNSQMAQYMMRSRVAAQAFTIIAMVGGLIVMGKKPSTDV
ncbi:respiratory supercomplex factor 1, mitochondrial isoform X1 [Bombus impatiens]|uniref:Respiratory supercomplex factor 1, mitochondrial isoform X1 n=1 Tax=Bombus impatiens TaxID=132113 RepID=A0A6P8LM77_BOMIM|nr:respiratory supercomplex factor 1, mitochondrial isoform X1 [Bombus impatiens]